MPMPAADTVRTSLAGAATSQPQLSNVAAANLLGMSVVSPLLAQANLGIPGTNAAGLGAGNPNTAADPNVELATALSHLMLGMPLGMPLAQMSLLGAASQPGLASLAASLAIQRGLFQAASGTSLLSSADQEQLLRTAGFLPPVSQTTATHPTFSAGINSSATASGSAPVNPGLGSQSVNPAESSFSLPHHESAHPHNFR